jgi:GntR family transcriptional regulator
MPEPPEPCDYQLPIERVTAELRRRIEAGEWKPGQRIPSTGELAEQYDVSRALAGNAIKQLTADGLLVTRRRWGTFVAPPTRASGQDASGRP